MDDRTNRSLGARGVRGGLPAFPQNLRASSCSRRVAALQNHSYRWVQQHARGIAPGRKITEGRPSLPERHDDQGRLIVPSPREPLSAPFCAIGRVVCSRARRDPLVTHRGVGTREGAALSVDETYLPINWPVRPPSRMGSVVIAAEPCCPGTPGRDPAFVPAQGVRLARCLAQEFPRSSQLRS